MPLFEMVKYHNKKYPANISIKTEEIAGHFDAARISNKMAYSLHTEYSYGKRKFSNHFLSKYEIIIQANKNGIPMLWYDKYWALAFANFIIDLTEDCEQLKYIEIHPPFNDYTNSMDVFIERYKYFENKIYEKFPDVQILIENRSGSLYRNGEFILSSNDEIIELANIAIKSNIQLWLTLDVPQLYTSHNEVLYNKNLYAEVLNKLVDINFFIVGVHLWGKRINDNGNRIAHVGDFNNYFVNDDDTKNIFLEALSNLFNDDKKRNMVLEVNSSNEDMISIINDLRKNNFIFI